MFNRNGEFSEEYRMQALTHVSKVYGLEVHCEKDHLKATLVVRIYERLPLRRILLCETTTRYLHEANSWISQQLNDYNSWR